MKVRVHLTKAFSKCPEQGNPAGVVLRAEKLSKKQMLYISAKLGFSESAFVSDLRHSSLSNKLKHLCADFAVSFFTPKVEVPICGHATIACFYTLIKKGDIKFNSKEKVKVKQKTKNFFPLPVYCYRDGFIEMVINNPKFHKPMNDKKTVAELLRISPSDILDRYPLQVVGTKLFIPIKSLKVLFNIKPNLVGIKEYCRQTKARGFYPFTQETVEKDSDFHTRQFNPLAGINEDPVTGMAAGALGSYTKRYKILNKNNITVEQGYILKKAGKVCVDYKNRIKIGGYATVFDERIIEI